MIRSISPRWLRSTAVTAACLGSMNVFAFGGTGTIGTEQLAQLDTNRDGAIAGDELRGLALWVDNGDAVVQPGEMRALADVGIVSISTSMNMTQGLMQSSATLPDGRPVLAEDVWFSLAPAAPADQPAAQVPTPLSNWVAGLGLLLAALVAGFAASRYAARRPIA